MSNVNHLTSRVEHHMQKIKDRSGTNIDHNRCVNELHQSLRSEGINAVKEKQFTSGNTTYTPDLFVKGVASIEVKAKTSGFDQHNRQQAENYVKATGKPTILANAGTQGPPNVRIFK